jgi:hypothetical protein
MVSEKNPLILNHFNGLYNEYNKNIFREIWRP